MPYIGTSPSNGVRRVFDYTATAGQTSFSGSDNNSQTLAYTDSAYIDVYQNGILLIPSDYTATTGTTVVLDTGATVSDTLQIVVYDVFSVADTVSASDGGSFGGNVGVGGTLAVTGNSTFSGEIITSTSGTSNVRIGENAGDAIASGGNYNVVVGDEAGTALTTGDDNVAVGYAALKTEDADSRNTAIGYEALTTLNAGADGENVAVGYRAGKSLTEGIQNTLIGTQAGDALTHADYNVVLGRNALTTDTQGHKTIAIGVSALSSQNFTSSTDTYNVAIGYNAGADLTDAERCVLIGGIAGEEITTADDNIAIGYRSGGGNAGSATTGHDNVCIGTDAGEKLEDGGQNVYIGRDAADAATSGGSNVCIGYLAGTFSTALTTGGTNTLIGSYTHAGTADASQSVGLGHSLTAATGYTTLGHGSSDIRAAHGNTTWSTVSDERYKKDIVDSTAGLSFINDLQPRTFKYKNLGDLPETFNSYEKGSTEVFKNTNTNHGFIAQEVKTAIDAHSEIKDGFRLWDDREDGSQEVAETALIPILTKAVQELSAKNDALEARIKTLESK